MQRAPDDRTGGGALRGGPAVGTGDGGVCAPTALSESAGRVPPVGLRERRAARPAPTRPCLALAGLAEQRALPPTRSRTKPCLEGHDQGMGRKRQSGRGPVLRLVVADDHRLLPEAVRALLEPDADIEIAGVAYEADRILTLVSEVKPDLLLLDPHMPRMDGLALLDNLRASHPEVAVMLLSESLDPELKAAALA